MNVRVKSGMLVKIPHLECMSKQDADAFLNVFDGSETYSMRLIKNNWYLERMPHDSTYEYENSHSISKCDLQPLSNLKSFLEKYLIDTFPSYYTEENFIFPFCYVFIGDKPDDLMYEKVTMDDFGN